jgi:hypothetical protein
VSPPRSSGGGCRHTMQGRSIYPRLRGYILHGFVRVQQRANRLQSLGVEFLRWTTVAATSPRSLETGESALGNQIALEFNSAPNTWNTICPLCRYIRSLAPLVPVNYAGNRLALDLDEIVLRPANRDHHAEFYLPGDCQQLTELVFHKHVEGREGCAQTE